MGIRRLGSQADGEISITEDQLIKETTAGPQTTTPKCTVIKDGELVGCNVLCREKNVIGPKLCGIT